MSEGRCRFHSTSSGNTEGGMEGGAFRDCCSQNTEGFIPDKKPALRCRNKETGDPSAFQKISCLRKSYMRMVYIVRGMCCSLMKGSVPDERLKGHIHSVQDDRSDHVCL